MDLAPEVNSALIKGALKELTENEPNLENPFVDADTRTDFTRKVFTIVTGQFIFTASVIAALSYIDFIAAALTKCNLWIMLVLTIIIIATIVFSWLFGKIAKQSPWNYRILVVITMSVTLFFTTTTASIYYRQKTGANKAIDAENDVNSAHIFVFYGINTVIALFITISTYEYFRNYPIYRYTTIGLFTAFVIDALVFACIGIFGDGNISSLHFVVLMTLLNATWMLFTFDQMLKGKHKYAFTSEDHIFGAITVYLAGGFVMLIVVRILLKRDSVREQAIGAVVGCC